MRRLGTIQRNLDSDTQNENSTATDHLSGEEKRLLVDSKVPRSKVASGVQALIEALRAIDAANAAQGQRDYGEDQRLTKHDELVPSSGGGVDRLLLILEYGNVQ